MALWHLKLTQDTFLKIIPAIFSKSQAMTMQREQERLVLGPLANAELFTGNGTNFMISAELEAKSPISEDLKGFSSDSVGDIKINFLARDGSKQSGYVCDYGWNIISADVFCQSLSFEKGLPTYNGRFTLEQGQQVETQFAISGVTCQLSEKDFLNCPFRMVGDKMDVMEQRSMLNWGGMGYSCRPKDRAGVICGSRAQIDKVEEKENACNSTEEATIGQVLKLEDQVNKVNNIMNNGKHWENYLLPIPVTVSLLASVMLQSANFPRAIMLDKPASGEFDYLKYNYYQPNLLQFAFSVTDTFKLSNKNMKTIYYNADDIQKYLNLAVKNAYSNNPAERKILFRVHMKEVETAANESLEKATEVVTAFQETDLILKELIEVVSQTDRNITNTAGKVKTQLDILKNVTSEIEEQKKNVTIQVENNRKAVEKARTAFYKKAEEAAAQECTDGTQVCKRCVHKKAWKTDKCQTMGTICAEYRRVSGVKTLAIVLFCNIVIFDFLFC